MIVDLPEPDGPTRKTNSPLSITKLASRRATTLGLVDLVTTSNTIIGVPPGIWASPTGSIVASVASMPSPSPRFARARSILVVGVSL